MAELAPVLKHKFTDSNDNPLVGGKLYSYVAGTTTPLATYSDVSGTPNTNPIILDANGECDLWISAGSSYKFVLTDSADVPQYTVDNIRGSAAAANSGFESLEVDNITIDGNTISSTNENGNIVLAPHGTGKVVFSSATASTVPYFDADKKLVSSAVTPTELGRLTGVESAIQTQLDAKAPTASPTFTGTVAGITKSMVGLGNVDNTSDATKNSAAATLTNKTLTDPIIDVVNLTEQGSSPTNPAAGTKKLYAKTDGKVYTKDSDGVEVEVGAGGGRSAGTNYAADYYDGTSVADITSSDASLTYAVNTSDSPLRANGNQRFSKDASDQSSQYWTVPLEFIDRADKNGALIVKFRYRTSSSYASNDVRVRVFVNNNGSYVNVSSLSSQSGYLLYSADSTLFTGSFQTDGNTDIELRLYVDTTNANAYDIDIVDLSVSPEQTVPGAIVADLGTETWTDDWTNATASVRLMRYGNRIVARGRTTVTGAGTTNYTLTIPAAYTPVQTPLTNQVITVGNATLFDASANSNYPGLITLLLPAGSLRILHTNTGAFAGLTSAIPFTWANGDFMEWEATWIVDGWSASAALSTTETMMMGAFASYAGNPASANSGAPIIVPTKRFDVLNSYNATTGLFTAPRTAKYKIYGSILSAQAAMSIWAYVAGVQVSDSPLGYTDSNGEATFSGVVEASAGQTIAIAQTAGTVDITLAVLNIEEWFNPTVFGPSGATALYPATGYSSGGLVNYVTTAGNFGDLDSETLQPGEYDWEGQATYFANGAVTTTYGAIGLSTTSGNFDTGLVEGENYIIQTKNQNSGTRDSIKVGVKGIVVTTPTTYYFKSKANTSITNLQIAWSWRFRKVK